MCTTYRVLQGFPAFLEFLFLGVYLFMCVNLFIAEYSLLQILLIAETLFRLSFFFSLFLHVFVCIAIYFFFIVRELKFLSEVFTSLLLSLQRSCFYYYIRLFPLSVKFLSSQILASFSL